MDSLETAILLSTILIIYFSPPGTVNFNHTFGCQQCMTRGEFSKVGRCMTFPRADAQLRTDINFRDRSQPTHHKERSIFEDLSIDMVRCFPTSDPLHLLDLGIMKRYIKLNNLYNRILIFQLVSYVHC